MKRLMNVERACWLLAAGAFAAFAVQHLVPAAVARAEVDEFERRLALAPAAVATPDTSAWSPARIDAYEAAAPDDVLGVLRIDRLSFRAPILAGSDPETLNQGIGFIRGTGRPGEGNTALAAHRDGFFRALKDVEVGDEVKLRMTDGEYRYRVTAMRVVDPADTYVLEPTMADTITLVTCYPFYFVGDAPERYVVFGMRITD